MKLEEGKLKTELLEKHILGNITYKRDDVSVRAGIGEDCAVMDFSSHEAVVHQDLHLTRLHDVPFRILLRLRHLVLHALEERLQVCLCQ